MNKNVAALLSVGHAQLTDLGPIVSRNVKQSSVADLPAHLRVERRPIQNDINFVLLFAWQNGLDDCFGLEKIVSKKFGRLDSELAFFNTDFFFLLCLARALALFAPSISRTRNINSESALARHQLREIERKSVRVVEFKSVFARYRLDSACEHRCRKSAVVC